MASLNKVQIIGNLGGDPDMRFTANGCSVANFNVACSRRYTTRDGEQRDDTEWVRVVCWERLAELAGQYLSKGRQVYVEGRLQTREWEDRDGNRRWTTEVVANDIQFLSGRGGGGDDDWGGGGRSGGGGGGYERGGPPPAGMDADDLPFE